MISKGFFKSTFIYTIVGSLPLAASLILLPFYTNALSTADFGLLAIYISFTLLVQILTSFNFDIAVATRYFEFKDDPVALKKFIGTIVAGLCLSGLLFSVIFTLTGEFLFGLFFREGSLHFFPYGLMSVLTAVCNGFFKTYSNLLINQGRTTRFFWSNILNFILTITISLAGLYMFPHSIEGPMWGRLLAGAGILILVVYFFSREFGLSLDLKLMRLNLAFSYPVVIYTIFVWVLSYIDRYIINNYMDKSDVGVYDFVVKCTFLIEFLQLGLNNSIYPKIFAAWKDQNLTGSSDEINKYHSAFTAVTILVVPSVSLLLVLAVPLVVLKPDYLTGLKFIPLLCAGYLFRGLFNMYVYPIYFFKKTALLPFLFFIIAVFQVSISILLIKNRGLEGAVYATILIKPIQLILLYMASRRFFTFRFNKIKLIGLPGTFLALMIVIDYFFREQLTFTILLELTIAAGLVYVVYRNEIREVYRKVFSKRPGFRD
jgi:O-antigen/teichoic acid export membrane protein